MMGGERADGVPTGAAALRWRLRAPGIVIVPGATDALTARVIEEDTSEVRRCLVGTVGFW